jgi:phosphatidylserine/phosphatidylglycerophosphate/cardiolipin synthase-like enzyme
LRVAALVDRAKVSLEVLIYSINRPSIVDAILRAKNRGAVVRVIVDATQIGEDKEQFQLQRLLAADIPVRRDTHRGSMHMKSVVVDNKEFLIGSFNFTNNATENNDESLLIWDCPRNAMLYKRRFELLWSKYTDATAAILKSSDGGVDAGR